MDTTIDTTTRFKAARKQIWTTLVQAGIADQLDAAVGALLDTSATSTILGEVFGTHTTGR
jgi:hypothetical protein